MRGMEGRKEGEGRMGSTEKGEWREGGRGRGRTGGKPA